jgi:hypothetical protein
MNTRGRTECRSCGEELHPLIDLGVSPLCESFLSKEQANCGEIFLDHASDYCATAIKRFDRLCFNLGADFLPATGASEREAGRRQRDHTWRA